MQFVLETKADEKMSRNTKNVSASLQAEFIGQAFGCLHTGGGKSGEGGDRGAEESQTVADSRSACQRRIP